MNQLNSPGRSRKRWLLPLAVLVVGSAIAIWASARESRRIHAIDLEITCLCRDVAYGAEVTKQLSELTSLEASTFEARLRRACPSPAMFDQLEVHVTPGDYTQAGQALGAATHTAMLRLANVDVLGLRIHHSEPNRIQIIGFFEPASP